MSCADLFWYDWASIIILLFLGAWKLHDISDKYGEKSAKWIIKKIEQVKDTNANP